MKNKIKCKNCKHFGETTDEMKSVYNCETMRYCKARTLYLVYDKEFDACDFYSKIPDFIGNWKERLNDE